MLKASSHCSLPSRCTSDLKWSTKMPLRPDVVWTVRVINFRSVPISVLCQFPRLAHSCLLVLPFTSLPALLDGDGGRCSAVRHFWRRAGDRYHQCRYWWQKNCVLLLIMQRYMKLYYFLNPLRNNQQSLCNIYCVFIQCDIMKLDIISLVITEEWNR